MSQRYDRACAALRRYGRSLGGVYTSETLVWAIICLGVLLRLVQYLHNRSLWYDELLIVNSILSGSFIDLLGPLKNHQFGPFGFLVLVKCAALLFGDGEYSLRLFPLICGIASVPLFYLLSKAILKPPAVPISLALFAITPSLVYYASEVKQYGVDVLAVVVLYLVFLHYSERAYTAKSIIVLSLCGAVLIWFSNPVVFILTGIGIVLLLSSILKKDAGQFVSLAIVLSICLLSFAVNYFTSLTYGIAAKSPGEHWVKYFAPLPVTPGNVRWYFNSVHDFFSSRPGFNLAYPVVWMIASLTGAVSIVQVDKKKGFFLLAPIVVTLCASIVHLYPLHKRLMLFVLPIVILLLVGGLWKIVESLPKSTPKVVCGLVLTLLLFLPILDRDGFTLFRPILFHPEEIKPVLEYVSDNKNAGDIIYGYYGANWAYDYYSHRYDLTDVVYVAGVSARENPGRYIEDIRAHARGHERFWLLYSHVHEGKEGDELALIVTELDKNGRRIDAFTATGAGVFLYDLSKKK